MKPRILAFAGSTRTDSYNKKLVRVAAAMAEAAGAEVTIIDLRDYPLPMFDEDEEKRGQPANAAKLRELFLAHHGLLISSPEYNSSISGVLKNMIDWVSRPNLAPWNGKVAGLLAASVGKLGGLRGLVALRSILGNIDVTVIPQQYALAAAGDAFDGDGQLNDEGAQRGVQSVVNALVHTTAALMPK
jgi:chromate reductase